MACCGQVADTETISVKVQQQYSTNGCCCCWYLFDLFQTFFPECSVQWSRSVDGTRRLAPWREAAKKLRTLKYNWYGMHSTSKEALTSKLLIGRQPTYLFRFLRRLRTGQLFIKPPRNHPNGCTPLLYTINCLSLLLRANAKFYRWRRHSNRHSFRVAWSVRRTPQRSLNSKFKLKYKQINLGWLGSQRSQVDGSYNFPAARGRSDNYPILLLYQPVHTKKRS